MLALLNVVCLGSNPNAAFPSFSDLGGAPYNVSYDKRALMINGEHALFLSGSVHPPRGTPDDWQTWIALAKKNNLNMLQVYIFWNYHEEEEGVYNWQGRGNLTLFMSKAAAAGIFVNLRIGPYVCAEWTYGGLPAWLGLKPGVEFRKTNAVWQPAMEKWFNTVIDRMAAGNFFATQGGPIVLVQVENELYGPDLPYVEWCGTMAHAALAKVKVDVPITMCNGETASTTINTCNGNQCTSYLEKNGQNGKVLISQPALWTENEGGFQTWGGAPPPGQERYYFWGKSIGEQSHFIFEWFARGGSHMNYYMWAGGNQFGRWTGDALTTMYAADAMVCPDGLAHEPKFSQMAAMHAALAGAAPRIVGDAAQLKNAVNLNDGAVAYVYGGTATGVAFIECTARCHATSVKLGAHTFAIVGGGSNPSSTLVDLEIGSVLFNTVTAAPALEGSSAGTSTPTAAAALGGSEERVLAAVDGAFNAGWLQWREPVLLSAVPAGVYSANASFSAATPVEQTRFTSCLAPDAADLGARSKRSTYAFYETTLPASSASTTRTLTVGTNQATAMLAFVDGALVAHAEDLAHGNGASITMDFALPAAAAAASTATSTLTLISEELGYANFGFQTGITKGVSGNVTLDGADITAASGGWSMRGGLAGEHLALFTAPGASKVKWSAASVGAAATWYKSSFATPSAVSSGASKLLLNATGLNRGRIWVNGHDVGRYYLKARNASVGCPSAPKPGTCQWNTSTPYTGSQCYGLQHLQAADISAAACAAACCAQSSPTWQWSSKPDAKGDVPGCWCGACTSPFMANPAWTGGHTETTNACATQTFYYIPKSWLAESGESNDITLFEGAGLASVDGDLARVGLALATMTATSTPPTIDFGDVLSCKF